jgi:hypothetical protein
MNVDPEDDCTFWYVNEWVPVTSSAGWQLRIGAFRFPACGGVPSTIHVGDLDRKAKNVGPNWRPVVKTTVHDNLHNPTSGALVTMNVSGFGTRTCTTQANGICEISVLVSDAVPNVTFTVMNLSKGGFTYDSGANHDPDTDSNGTTIVVNRP